MKGVVFNLMEEIVGRVHGDDAWDAILERAGLDGVYASVGSYPDDEFRALVAAASDELDVPRQDVVRWIGREAMPLFARRYPDLFVRHTGTRSFVLALNDIIHPEVRKLYPGAGVPVFDYAQDDDGALLLGYRSRRRLCALAEGLAHGAADHFGERLVIEQPECMLRGDEQCVLRLTVGRA